MRLEDANYAQYLKKITPKERASIRDVMERARKNNLYKNTSRIKIR